MLALFPCFTRRKTSHCVFNVNTPGNDDSYFSISENFMHYVRKYNHKMEFEIICSIHGTCVESKWLY